MLLLKSRVQRDGIKGRERERKRERGKGWFVT